MMAARNADDLMLRRNENQRWMCKTGLVDNEPDSGTYNLSAATNDANNVGTKTVSCQ